MRDYSKISPQFWIGATGKKLRLAGVEAQIVSMYLISSPHSNMLGLYYCPAMFIAHETGLSFEGASKGLERAIEAGFCDYDTDSEMVWVYEMASYQVGETLKPEDKRCQGIQNEYNSLPQNRFLAGFFDKYSDAFNLKTKRETPSPIEAPCQPHRSQEQEHEQEQEQEQVKPVAQKQRFDFLLDEFETFWTAYPKRPGASKADALKAWKARVKEGCDAQTMINGAQRYALYCTATQTEPQFIKQPTTFLGTGRHFEGDWTVPAATPRSTARTPAPENFASREYAEGAL